MNRVLYQKLVSLCDLSRLRHRAGHVESVVQQCHPALKHTTFFHHHCISVTTVCPSIYIPFNILARLLKYLSRLVSLQTPSRRTFKMAWQCSGSTNKELIDNLWKNMLITDARVKAAFLKVFESTIEMIYSLTCSG